MSGLIAGIDIGGTKCAVTLGRPNGGGAMQILAKRRFPTPATPEATITALMSALRELLAEQSRPLDRIGISCGGPLDSMRGIVLSPPNLPGWIDIPIVEMFQTAFGAPAVLQNDAKAGALAEWMWGAGKGARNLIFLTFGTGMGAGLILDGRLYTGTNDMGGEVGHMRLSDDGPVGFGKAGSFEGWCSGGGIRRLAIARAEAAILAGNPPTFAPTLAELPDVTAEKVFKSDDPLAHEIIDLVCRRLGQGLSILIDVLNPEIVILGSIYMRQKDRIDAIMRPVLQRETISYSLDVCRIVQPGLGESIGDFAALAVARYLQPSV